MPNFDYRFLSVDVVEQKIAQLEDRLGKVKKSINDQGLLQSSIAVQEVCKESARFIEELADLIKDRLHQMACDGAYDNLSSMEVEAGFQREFLQVVEDVKLIAKDFTREMAASLKNEETTRWHELEGLIQKSLQGLTCGNKN
ncbi:hypothetical protein [Chitinimonas lacunae]|uniref:Uncharacterized protein n=1 Tax=Chitinimonas lacunae TaxID=1963018 RepID=A0ABV8MVQ5_9NEIS